MPGPDSCLATRTAPLDAAVTLRHLGRSRTRNAFRVRQVPWEGNGRFGRWSGASGWKAPASDWTHWKMSVVPLDDAKSVSRSSLPFSLGRFRSTPRARTLVLISVHRCRRFIGKAEALRWRVASPRQHDRTRPWHAGRVRALLR